MKVKGVWRGFGAEFGSVLVGGLVGQALEGPQIVGFGCRGTVFARRGASSVWSTSVGRVRLWSGASD